MKQRSNRRRDKRLKIPGRTKVNVHLLPVLPFIGVPVEGSVANLSASGLGLTLFDPEAPDAVRKGSKVKIHFRVPGHRLVACAGRVVRNEHGGGRRRGIGIRFTSVPAAFRRLLALMIEDNAACDSRIRNMRAPMCRPTCSYFALCVKPLKPQPSLGRPLEIALQSAA